MRIWTSGFEPNRLDTSQSYGGTISIDNANQLTGSYCLEANAPIGASNAYYNVLFKAVYTALYFRLYMKSNASVSGSRHVLRVYDASFNPHLQFNIDGQVDRWTGAAWANLGDFGTLTTSYRRYEFKIVMSTDAVTADGDVEVKIDGVVVLTLNNIITVGGGGAATTLGAMQLGVLDPTGDIVGSVFYDDVGVNDTTGVVSNSWLGPGAVIGDAPDADGAHSDWTPSAGVDHYALVDTQNDATDISTDTPGDQDLFEFPDSYDPAHNGIVAFALWVRAQRAAGAATVSHLYRQAGTDWVLPAFTLTAAWDFYDYHTSENPIYNGMLTRGIFNAAEYGIKAIT